MKTLRFLVVLGIMAMLAAGCGSTGRTTGASARTMKGSALLTRVRAAYQHVPAVRIVVSNTPQHQRYWIDVLRRGRITAAQTVARYPHHAPTLVFAYPDGRAYNFIPNTRCWVVNRLGWIGEGRGERFPNNAIKQGTTARRVGNMWRLPIVSQVGATDTLLIDAKTLLVKTRLFGGARYAEHYKALTRAPSFPMPRPLCRK